jgi:hypothetical protein
MFTEREYSRGVLNTVDSIIDALGGTAEAARLAHVGASAVSNWKARGRIPSEQYSVFGAALERAGLEFDASLFGMRPIETAAEARP